jgi:two-component system OmpR family response regulator
MAAETHVLVVEDDREIRGLLARALRASEFRVSLAADGREMDRILADSRVDLVILDLMLPGEDGFTICRRLRARTRLPIVIVSARSDETDRVVGLELGADDYVVKPFGQRELVARVRAVLRRAPRTRDEAESNQASVFTFEGWRLDARRRKLTDAAGAQIVLTDAEFDLLRVMCARPGRILSRELLLDLTQGRALGPNERSIDILVARLRRKLEGCDAREWIRTVRSGGYMFTPEVEPS